MLRLIRVASWRLFLGCLLLLAACGGGGGGGAAINSSPTISNLSFSPSTAYIDLTTNTATITGSLTFSDAGGDVTAVKLTSSAGANITIPVNGASGVKNATVSGTITVAASAPAAYQFDVWAVDAAGNSSNHLSGTVNVAFDDTATTWTARASPTVVNLNGVAFSGTRYVAVGDTIVTSTDAISWTPVAAAPTAVLNAVVWTGSEFVAVGNAGTVLISSDGLRWTSQSTGAAAYDLNCLVWSGAQFVAGSSTPSSQVGTDAPLFTSADGVTWAQRASGLSDWDWLGAAWSGTRFVAVGAPQYTGTGPHVTSSIDGITWSTQPITLTPYISLTAVTWANSEFAAVGAAGMSATSPDGLAWSGAFTGIAYYHYGITWSGSRFVAVGDGVETSTDGVQWTSYNSPPLNNGGLRSVLWDGKRYVAVGGGGQILTSP